MLGMLRPVEVPATTYSAEDYQRAEDAMDAEFLNCKIKTDGSLFLVSRGWEQLGYDLEELVGHKVVEFLHPDDQAMFVTMLDKMRRRPRWEGHDRGLEGQMLRFVGKDGTVLVVECWHFHRYGPANSPRGFWAFGHVVAKIRPDRKVNGEG